jgi:hypothetical protein
VLRFGPGSLALAPGNGEGSTVHDLFYVRNMFFWGYRVLAPFRQRWSLLKLRVVPFCLAGVFACPGLRQVDRRSAVRRGVVCEGIARAAATASFDPAAMGQCPAFRTHALAVTVVAK